ncbi:MAG: M3 family oligoendopeptidase [Saprospiraceae bacterium]|jgi:M3 family oligoendopeptidase
MKFSQIEYTRPDLDKISNEFTSLINLLKSADSFESFENSMSKINVIRENFESFQSLVHVRHSIDTKNEFYEGENKFFDKNSPKIAQLSNEFYKTIVESDFKSDLNNKYGNHFLNGIECSLKTFHESIMELLGKENEVSSEYNSIIASAEVELNGEKLTLSQLAPHATSVDRKLRKQSSDVANDWFHEKGKILDDNFHQLVQIRHEIAQKLGYKNFVELGYNRLGRTDYGAKEVKQFRDAVHEHIVPVVNKLRDRQKDRIGVDKLEYYDIGFQFKTGNPKPKGDPAFIIANGKKMYSELSPETKEFFEFMQDNELMDLEAKPGKMAGGYCTYMPAFKSPYIFSNFNGTSGDIDVLTHEAGHAFQIFNSREQPLPEYYWPTMEACEIHSMSMEFLTWNWMELFFKEDTAKYKFSHLSSGLLFLPYGVAIDEFQHWIYENPTVTPVERNSKWLEIEAKYMPYKANSSSEFIQTGRQWQRQGHLYRMPFYYIDYTLAQVCAYQFWKKSQDNFTSAWGQYLALCKLGGSDSFTGLLKQSNLEDPFNPTLLKEVSTWVESYLETVDDTKF